MQQWSWEPMTVCSHVVWQHGLWRHILATSQCSMVSYSAGIELRSHESMSPLESREFGGAFIVTISTFMALLTELPCEKLCCSCISGSTTRGSLGACVKCQCIVVTMLFIVTTFLLLSPEYLVKLWIKHYWRIHTLCFLSSYCMLMYVVGLLALVRVCYHYQQLCVRGTDCETSQ